LTSNPANRLFQDWVCPSRTPVSENID